MSLAQEDSRYREYMGARGYGISLREFNSKAQE